jgi:holo-[acyl-carrier protein] synthase
MTIFGMGTEIVEVLRIARMVERHAEQFLTRALTAKEIKYCQSRAHATQHISAHWAAKEAVLKALGITMRRGLRWNDLEIRRVSTNKFRVALRGGMRDKVEKLNVGEIYVTMAYCHTHATATAIAMTRD